MENRITYGVSDFIQSNEYSISVTIDSANIAADGNGKKIVYAGTALGTSSPFARTKKARVAVLASLTTALTGTNNDLVWTAKNAYSDGTLKIAYIDPSANSQTLKIDFSANDNTVKVLLATSGAGAITTTANDIIAMVNSNLMLKNIVSVAKAADNDGSGVVTALTATATSGGYPAVGYAVNTVDVTDGDQPVSMIIEGVVYNTVTDYQINGIKIIPK